MIKYLKAVLLCLAFSLCILQCNRNKEEKQPDFKELRSIAEENSVVGMTVLRYRDGDVLFKYNYSYSGIDRKVKVDDNTI